MPFLTIRGNQLHYLEAGQGRPIIFFHSTPATAQFYRPQLAHLAARYRVIAVDLRGHGDSDKPAGPYKMSEFLADYVAIFEALQLKDFVLAGCSVGGIVAQLYALEHGANLQGLVLIGSPCSRRGRDVAGFHKAVEQKGWEAVVRGLVDKQLHSSTAADVKEWAVQEYLKTPLHVRQAEEEALLADVHHTERLHEIPTPTLLVAGEAEEREIFEQMALMATKIPRAQWHVLPNAAHMPNFERPAEFNRILDRFLEDIRY
ncbi:MAG: hydrolase, alpha/beta fold family [Ramlibacter sp.]|nr:hydrolase, alpha/beta fold family [Ramlibacter sp.]